MGELSEGESEPGEKWAVGGSEGGVGEGCGGRSGAEWAAVARVFYLGGFFSVSRRIGRLAYYTSEVRPLLCTARKATTTTTTVSKVVSKARENCVLNSKRCFIKPTTILPRCCSSRKRCEQPTHALRAPSGR